jgi:type II secretory pathway predicted ATPase ExeA
MICDGIKDNQMIAISGDVGQGKTHLFTAASRKLSANIDSAPKFVYVRNFDKESLNVGNIMNAIIQQLSEESPRRDKLARSTQTVRILGKFINSTKRRVSVVIEEAHRLHYNTLRSLKEMREAEMYGICPLFSVILIGHPDLANKLERRKEVYWRSNLIELNSANGWMNLSERTAYIGAVYGDAVTPVARERIATLCRVPLQINRFVEGKMTEAFHAGYAQVNEECVQLSNYEWKEALNLSYKEIADEAGIGKTTVIKALRGQGSENTSDAVSAAISRLRNKQLSEAM